MSLIKIEGVQSLSAPTKAQKDAAVYMFGSKGHSIVAVLDKFSRAKEVRTAHIDGLLKLMKDGDDEEIIKFTASAPGKKTIAAAKQFAVAKTLAASIKALKLVRVPMKWIDGHSDAAAARITETKEIRARKTAGNRPEKPIKLDNPHAPEATVVTQTDSNSPLSRIYTLPKSVAGYGYALTPQWKAIIVAANEALKGMFVLKWAKSEGCPQIIPVGKGYRSIPNAYLGAAVADNSWHLYAVAPSDKKGSGIEGRMIGNKLTMASVAAFMRDVMAQQGSPQTAAINKMIAGATVFDKEVVITEANNPDLKAIGDVKRAQDAEGTAKGAINSVTKITPTNVSKITRGAQVKIEQQLDSKLSGVLGNAQFREKGTYLALDGYLFEMSAPESYKGVAKLASYAVIPPQTKTGLAGKNWRVSALKIGRASAADIIDIGPKFSLAKVKSAVRQLAGAAESTVYTPSGKTDIALVDELAEIPARKISAKPLQAREEYFNALRTVLQNNLPKREVSATSTGVVIGGSKLHTLRLDNNTWTLQTGVTGKTKKVGSTFDIVDLLALVDKGILRPKPEGGSTTIRKQPPFFDRVTKDAKTGEYRTIIQANENQAYQVAVKREGDTFVFTSPVYPAVQRFVTQGMTEADVMWETFTGKSVTFSKEDADKFEKWLKSIRKTQSLTSNYLFPAIAPTRSGGGMSM
ncbi:hypothetical protein pEaSNUABM35_00245 [Erwinia phage pEa_SNUABM_35]|uniref:Uncharacterized protein n=1 Tax=Erwinia phage pEa_SNUABM_35 TaxID=2869557 RepID=A0AAE8C247_9CAUD|nr:hypothetical protein MPK65_gp245 [Erwinia phage pEa_SNUABM_35]QZE60162.1 hypothetical protein pEaSNUABM35_00245 [Erwinia phage pEa_SNUABM_35]QZE60498.1 hypothetical protein pEaSNUABM36_00245 [Erwinia phage pEa_SNUABM_36]